MKNAIKKLVPKLFSLSAAIVLSLSSTTVAFATELEPQMETKNQKESAYTIHWNDTYGYMHSFGCDDVEQAKSFVVSLGEIVTVQNPNYYSCERAVFNAGINSKNNNYYDFDENDKYYVREESPQKIQRTFDTEQWIDNEGKIDEAFFETKFFEDCRYYVGRLGVSEHVFTGCLSDTMNTAFAHDWYLLFDYERKEIPVEIQGDEYGTVSFEETFKRSNITVKNVDFTLPENQSPTSFAQIVKVSETSDLALDYYMEQEDTVYVFDDRQTILYFTVDWKEDYKTKKVVCKEAAYVNERKTEDGGTYYEAFFDFSKENMRTEPVAIELIAESSEKSVPTSPTTPDNPTEPTPPTTPKDDVDTDKMNVLFPIVVAVGVLAGGGYYFLVLLPEKKMVKIRGVWIEDGCPSGVKVKGYTKMEHPELWHIQAILKNSISREDFVAKLVNCGTYTLFPSDTVISIVTADGCLKVQDEMALFKKLIELEQITSVTFVSKSKGFEYAIIL